MDAVAVGSARRDGLAFHPAFVPPGRRAEELVPWVRRQAIDQSAAVAGIEIPEGWSDLAAATVASSYLRWRQDGQIEAWRLGLKSIAIYRDGSERLQSVESETCP